MRPYVVLEKKRGQTPLEALEAWRSTNAEYANVSASYAGRLDPMAQGKLLILLGEECKRQERYTKLDKEYEVEVLFDIGSDTGDALGLVEYAGKQTRIDLHLLKKVLHKERGAHRRAYPIFSSKTVNGKPLFLCALEGKLDEISIPTHVEHIYAIDHLSSTKRTQAELKDYIEHYLSDVPTSDDPSKALGADFRIKEVRAAWEQLFAQAGERPFISIRLRITCASGTYMRSLAGRIGEAFGTKALALSIERTKLGKHLLGTWWLKTYKG